MKRPVKRLLALLLVLALAVGLLPTLSFAEQAADAPTPAEQAADAPTAAERAVTTLTYLYGDEVLSTASVTIGGTVTLPTPSSPNPNWTFLGWMDHPIGTTHEEPDYYPYGTTYTVTSPDPFLYGLYSYMSDEPDGGVEYRLVTSSSQFTEGGRT